MMRFSRIMLTAAATAAMALAATAQTSTAKPADDTPSIKLGATIFADFTYQQSPTTSDADGNTIHSSSFNVARSYLNVTGNLNHRISFRITPDISRETGSGSSLTGSYTFRLKYAFAQLSLDDWTTKGSWVRLGLQQTPFIDPAESTYRYRFQGPIFVDREGFLTASDSGVSARWNAPGNNADIHGGFFNGEGYSKAEANNEKAFQVRGSIRPLPAMAIWKGLRLTAFVDDDRYVASAKRNRVVGEITFEHPRFNAGLDYLTAKDQTSAAKAEVHARGYSLWVTPKLINGWELLLRHDQLEPNTSVDQQKKRNIIGIAYWVPNLNKVTTAVMLDYDSTKQTNFSPSRPDDTRYGLKLLVNF